MLFGLYLFDLKDLALGTVAYFSDDSYLIELALHLFFHINIMPIPSLIRFFNCLAWVLCDYTFEG
jgi:hypothetical protein